MSIAVEFEVSGQRLELPEGQATILAENLRRRGAGQLGEYGVEGATSVADDIEAVLVTASDAPIQVDGERAESVFYTLDVSIRPRDPQTAEATALHRATQKIRDERLSRE
jgi:hypothetical protein